MTSRTHFQIGILQRPVYAYPPKHFSKEKKYRNKVLTLHRSLYGLKGTVKIWYETVSSHFKTYGPKEMESAPFVFHKKESVVIYYADKLLILNNDKNEIRKFKINLQNNVVTKHLGQTKNF